MRDSFELIQAAMTDEPRTPQELTQHDIASRLASVTSELDDLISLSRDFDAPDLQQAVCAERRAISAVLVRAQLLASFIESREPRRLHVVGRGKP